MMTGKFKPLVKEMLPSVFIFIDSNYSEIERSQLLHGEKEKEQFRAKVENSKLLTIVFHLFTYYVRMIKPLQSD